MRCKRVNGKRILALALALSLTIGDSAIISAMPADGVTEEVVTDEAVSENDIREDAKAPVISQNGAEDMEAEDVETEQTEEELSAEQAYDGSLSKVIGIRLNPDFDSYFSDENGNTVMRYSYMYNEDDSIYVPGKVKSVTETGQALYSYGGKYYTYSSYDSTYDVTTLSNEVTLLTAEASTYYDKNTGLCNVGGVLYEYLSDVAVSGKKVAYIHKSGSHKATILKKYPANMTESDRLADLYKNFGRYTKSAAYFQKQGKDMYKTTPDYYVINGAYYRYIDYQTAADGGYTYYVDEYDRIVPDGVLGSLTWNSLSLPNASQVTVGDYNRQIGYQVMVNGVQQQEDDFAYDKNGAITSVVTYGVSDVDKMIKSGQTVNVQVRGLTYHYEYRSRKNTNGNIDNYYVRIIDAYGEWSDVTPVSFSMTMLTPVTGVTATKMTQSDTIQVRWNTQPGCSSYYLYYIHSKKALKVQASNFDAYYRKDADALAQSGVTAGDMSSSYSTVSNDYYNYSYSKEYPYHYFAVVPYNVADSAKYQNLQNRKTVTQIAAVATEAIGSVYTPALTNFRAEKQQDGTLSLRWDPVNAAVKVYAYESASFPAYYEYKGFNLYTSEAKTASYRSSYSLANNMQLKDSVKLGKVKTTTRTAGSTGVEDVVSSLYLIPGKTYYFVARTYDDTIDYEKTKTPIKYSYTTDTVKNGVVVKETVTKEYVYYPTFGPLTGVVSAKTERKAPTVYTTTTKNSVQMQINASESYTSYTGFEIYRKSGKKFKKIVTTTDNIYTDTGLKANTKYYYKVRGYYYDKDTKKTYYSEYTYTDVITGATANISLTGVKKSTTSVKLKWTKVAAATKYEIYRCYESYTDYTKIAKKNNASGIPGSLSNTRYEFVKTISKAKTTTYTDKNLTPGESYTYVIKAYLKNGKKVEYISASWNVDMKVSAPKNIYAAISGTTAKVTWDADKYATKYQVSYTVYRPDGTKVNEVPIQNFTKKNSYKISGISNGMYVMASVRAYGKNKRYSGWSTVPTARKYLATSKSITASNVTVNGKNGVKLSWKAVAGAKYYVVRRSTRSSTYNVDKKGYASSGLPIQKESNDNYSYSSSSYYDEDGYRANYFVYYKDYAGVSGSIVGTTAYDFAQLDSGVTYYYTVIAYGDVYSGTSESAIYSEYSPKPAAVTFGAKSSVKSLKNKKKGQVTVSITKISGAKKYQVYRSEKKSKGYKLIGTTKKTTYTDKKAKKGKTYYYKVAATGTNALKADFATKMSSAKKVKVKK